MTDEDGVNDDYDDTHFGYYFHADYAAQSLSTRAGRASTDADSTTRGEELNSSDAARASTRARHHFGCLKGAATQTQHERPC